MSRAEAIIERAFRLLAGWAAAAEAHWYPMPDGSGMGCYGTGYNAWGVQTNQKYLGALATLNALGGELGLVSEELRSLARERALAALRYSLRSHLSGDYRRTDGSQWGHTWISGLGIERMMYGVYQLEPWMSEQDRADLRRVLLSEADWLYAQHQRGQHQGVYGDKWNHTGRNVPESNLWNGAILWRAASMYPDHPDAAAWRERAHGFLVNAISVDSDATSEAVLAGKLVRERFAGANFFPNYALDHHGYLNVGYMVICLSNAAMLHFDMRSRGLPVPETLYHHNADLWRVLRRMIFADGRLARIGGDSRIRYVYCQEFLLPTLPYAAQVLQEPHAFELLEGQMRLVEGEAAHNGDGTFYGKRMTTLLELSPYYYTRLESDRACALAMMATYLHQSGLQPPAASGSFEASAGGLWSEPEHGAALHRSPTRLASFSWRALGLAQGLCQPPDDGHLAEWQHNLAGTVRFLGDTGVFPGARDDHRQLLAQRVETFDGGFITRGAVMEGVNVALEEGYLRPASAVHQIAYVALPDDHTVVGLQYARTLPVRTYTAEVKGLQLNLPNDLYNGFRRLLEVEGGQVELCSPPERDEAVPLGSRWACLAGRVGVIGLYGADELVVDRAQRRRGGRFQSLYVDEICFHHVKGTHAVDADRVILDVGWQVIASADTGRTRQAAGAAKVAALPGEWLRAVDVRGQDGRRYLVVANWSEAEASFAVGKLAPGRTALRDLVTGEVIAAGDAVPLAPRSARVLVQE